MLATPADLAALKAAAQPVYASLERDAQTRAADRAHPRARAGTARARGARRVRAAGSAPDRRHQGPDARSRTGSTARTCRPPSCARAASRPGTRRATAGCTRSRSGAASGAITPTARERLADCVGSYSVSGGRVTVVCEGFELFSAAWTLRDGLLRFTDIRTHEGDPLRGGDVGRHALAQDRLTQREAGGDARAARRAGCRRASSRRTPRRARRDRAARSRRAGRRHRRRRRRPRPRAGRPRRERRSRPAARPRAWTRWRAPRRTRSRRRPTPRDRSRPRRR